MCATVVQVSLARRKRPRPDTAHWPATQNAERRTEKAKAHPKTFSILRSALCVLRSSLSFHRAPPDAGHGLGGGERVAAGGEKSRAAIWHAVDRHARGIARDHGVRLRNRDRECAVARDAAADAKRSDVDEVLIEERARGRRDVRHVVDGDAAAARDDLRGRAVVAEERAADDVVDRTDRTPPENGVAF